MNLLNQFLWVVFPYIMLTIFVVGHIHRYNTDQFGWSAQSSKILEKRILKWGRPLFHYGIIFAFFGHVGGIIIPKYLFDSIGIDEHLYHIGAVWFGGAAGLVTLFGIIILVYRRLAVSRIRINSGTMDILVVLLLLLLVIQGTYMTIVRNALVGAFQYRETIGPWFRSLLLLKPNPAYMTEVPLIFQFHVLTGFLFFGFMPYTRIVHLWSLPLEYLKRSYIVYRSHNFLRTLRRVSRVKQEGNR